MVPTLRPARAGRRMAFPHLLPESLPMLATQLHTLQRTPWFRYLLYLGAAVLLAWLIHGVMTRMSGGTGDAPTKRYRDFLEFYAGAEALAQGKNVYTAGELGYIYPPICAVLMMPLTKLPIGQAAWVWLALKAALLAACAWLGAREMQRRFALPAGTRWAWLVLVMGLLLDLDKVRTEMNMQQTNLVLLFCFILALRWLERRPWASGFAIAFALNIKYQHLAFFFLPYLLLKRRFQAALAMGVGCVFWAFIPAVFIGWTRNLDLWRGLLGGAMNLAVPGHAAPGTAKINVPTFGTSIPAWSALHIGGGRQTPLSLAAMAGVFALLLLVVWLVYRYARAAGQPALFPTPARAPLADGVVALEWAGIVLAGVAFCPSANSPHMSMLLLPCLTAAGVLCLPSGGQSAWPLLVGLALLVFGLNWPPSTWVETLQWWRESAGATWCMLLLYPPLLWVGLRRLQAQTGAAGAA